MNGILSKPIPLSFYQPKEGSSTKEKKVESMRNNLFETFFKPEEDTEHRVMENTSHIHIKQTNEFKLKTPTMQKAKRKASGDFLEIIDDCLNRLCESENQKCEKNRLEKFSILKKLTIYEEKIRELFTAKKLLLLDLSVMKNRERDFEKQIYELSQVSRKLRAQNQALALKLKYTQDALEKERQESHQSIITLKKILIKSSFT